MLPSTEVMDAETLYDSFLSLGDVALGTGARLLFIGAYRRSASGACLALSSAPLRYRDITGRWPVGFNGYGRVDDDACIKVVMKPGTSTMYHALSNSSHH